MVKAQCLSRAKRLLCAGTLRREKVLCLLSYHERQSGNKLLRWPSVTTLARRMRDYNYRIAEMYSLPVASLVLLADEHPNWRPRSFHQQLPHTVIEFSFGTAKLLAPTWLEQKAHNRATQCGRLDDGFA